jgi:transcriptional regulator with XRE-family HTH domain
MLEDKEIYTLRELIESLPYSLRQFGKDYKISEVTIARIRDGNPAIRSTINKLLTALSSVYGKTFTQHNVQGIIFRGEAKDERRESIAERGAKESASGITLASEEQPWYLPEQKEENTSAEEKSKPEAA